MVSTHFKNISQNWNLPQVGMNIRNIWNHHLGVYLTSIGTGISYHPLDTLRVWICFGAILFPTWTYLTDKNGSFLFFSHSGHVCPSAAPSRCHLIRPGGSIGSSKNEWCHGWYSTGSTTLRQSNIAIENGPFEDVFPINNGDFPLLC